MIKLEEAQDFIFGKCPKLPAAKVEISESRGLVMADSVLSTYELSVIEVKHS